MLNIFEYFFFQEKLMQEIVELRKRLNSGQDDHVNEEYEHQFEMIRNLQEEKRFLEEDIQKLKDSKQYILLQKQLEEKLEVIDELQIKNQQLSLQLLEQQSEIQNYVNIKIDLQKKNEVDNQEVHLNMLASQIEELTNENMKLRIEINNLNLQYNDLMKKFQAGPFFNEQKNKAKQQNLAELQPIISDLQIALAESKEENIGLKCEIENLHLHLQQLNSTKQNEINNAILKIREEFDEVTKILYQWKQKYEKIKIQYDSLVESNLTLEMEQIQKYKNEESSLNQTNQSKQIQFKENQDIINEQNQQILELKEKISQLMNQQEIQQSTRTLQQDNYLKTKESNSNLNHLNEELQKQTKKLQKENLSLIEENQNLSIQINSQMMNGRQSQEKYQNSIKKSESQFFLLEKDCQIEKDLQTHYEQQISVLAQDVKFEFILTKDLNGQVNHSFFKDIIREQEIQREKRK